MTTGTTILGVWAMPPWPSSVIQITNSQDVVRFGWGCSWFKKKVTVQNASFEYSEDQTCNLIERIPGEGSGLDNPPAGLLFWG